MVFEFFGISGIVFFDKFVGFCLDTPFLLNKRCAVSKYKGLAYVSLGDIV